MKCKLHEVDVDFQNGTISFPINGNQVVLGLPEDVQRQLVEAVTNRLDAAFHIPVSEPITEPVIEVQSPRGEKISAHWKARKETGLCIYCDNPRVKGKMLCRSHNLRHAFGQKRRHSKNEF